MSLGLRQGAAGQNGRLDAARYATPKRLEPHLFAMRRRSALVRGDMFGLTKYPENGG